MMDSPTQQERLQHIVESFALAGGECEIFAAQLVALREQYPWYLLEWALVEVLVQNWLRYPLPRGTVFLAQVKTRLAEWQGQAQLSTYVTPEQFEQVTGLPAWQPEPSSPSQREDQPVKKLMI